jgi:hypothetical protein
MQAEKQPESASQAIFNSVSVCSTKPLNQKVTRQLSTKAIALVSKEPYGKPLKTHENPSLSILSINAN